MEDSNKKTIQIICGPTASGKTKAALLIAEKHGNYAQIEIISADSRQIIKQLNIGTAKPTEAERAKTTFHLLDIIEPGQRYTVFEFIEDANKLIKDILSRGKIPLIVGGTGLYLKALTKGVVEIDESDKSLREKLEKDIQEGKADFMYEKLRKIDPAEAAKFHPNNHVRLVRALEIYYLTGKSKSELLKTASHRKTDFNYLYNAILPERAELYEKINNRIDQMLKSGWLTEIEELIEKGLLESIKKANVIGYNELIDYLQENISYENAVELIKKNSRNYAKRQYTWFNNQIESQKFMNPNQLKSVLCL